MWFAKEAVRAVIEEANKEVSKFITSVDRKRSPYLKVTPHQKATMARYAAEHSFRILPLSFLHSTRLRCQSLFTCKYMHA